MQGHRPLTLLAGLLLATASGAQTTTLLHHFDFSTDASSRVAGQATATGSLYGGAQIAGGALTLAGTAWVDLSPVVPVAQDQGQSSWTVSVWARSTLAAGQAGALLSQGALAGYLPDYTLSLTAHADGSGTASALNRSGWSGGGQGSVADAGQWHLYTTVMSHFSAALYIDGVYQGGSGNSLYPCCFTSQAARIGREVASFGSQFSGSIDDLRIYSGTLDMAAMQAQFAAGPGAVSAVPEPAPTALLGLGGLALWLRRRRAA